MRSADTPPSPRHKPVRPRRPVRAREDPVDVQVEGPGRRTRRPDVGDGGRVDVHAPVSRPQRVAGDVPDRPVRVDQDIHDRFGDLDAVDRLLEVDNRAETLRRHHARHLQAADVGVGQPVVRGVLGQVGAGRRGRLDRTARPAARPAPLRRRSRRDPPRATRRRAPFLRRLACRQSSTASVWLLALEVNGPMMSAFFGPEDHISRSEDVEAALDQLRQRPALAEPAADGGAEDRRCRRRPAPPPRRSRRARGRRRTPRTGTCRRSGRAAPPSSPPPPGGAAPGPGRPRTRGTCSAPPPGRRRSR